MNVGSLLLANAQSAKLVEPGKTAFNNPSPSAQPAAVLGVAPSKPRNDVPGAQTLTNCLCIVTAVAQYAIRATSGATALSLQRWDGIDKG